MWQNQDGTFSSSFQLSLTIGSRLVRLHCFLVLLQQVALKVVASKSAQVQLKYQFRPRFVLVWICTQICAHIPFPLRKAALEMRGETLSIPQKRFPTTLMPETHFSQMQLKFQCPETSNAPRWKVPILSSPKSLGRRVIQAGGGYAEEQGTGQPQMTLATSLQVFSQDQPSCFPALSPERKGIDI